VERGAGVGVVAAGNLDKFDVQEGDERFFVHDGVWEVQH
jgi:hypothetical protein